MGALRLLLPQNQVYALEPGLDVVHAAGEDLGWIEVADGRWPVCCLSEDLQPVRQIPPGRNICALLHTDAGPFGVLCDQVVMLGHQAEVDLLPVPACMRTTAMRLRGLVLDGEHVLCVASAPDLLAGVGEQHSPAEQAYRAELAQGGAT